MQSTRSMFFLVLILAIALLAGCGDSDEPTPSPTPTIVTNTPTAVPPPTATMVPTPTPTLEPMVVDPEEAAIRARIFNLPNDVLGSFRSRGTLSLITTFENDEREEEELNLEAAFVKAENEFGFNQFFQLGVVRADLDQPQTVAIYESENVVAALHEGNWRTAQRSHAILSMADNPFVPPLVEFSIGLSDAEEIGIEEMDGIEAIHFRSNDPQLFLRVAGLDMSEGQEIEAVQMDIWIATEGVYILAYEMRATINDAMDFNAAGEQARVDQNILWEFDVYDIEAEIDITIPDEAPEPSAAVVPGFDEGSFPLPQGAEMKINIFGQAEIMTNLSEDEVVNFYQQKLMELGWKIEGNFGLYEATKDDLHFSLAMSSDDQGRTKVQIRD